MHTEINFDVAIVGGSYAGLSAALQLARARRRVAVIDAGQWRNRFAPTSHGFLTQDGAAPAQIIGTAWQQLQVYPTVQRIDGQAVQADGANGDAFALRLQDGRHLQARRLVLATGVVDELPAIAGLAERWGRSVFHCPYCHGYELDQGRIGVLASSELSLHHALMLPDWGTVTLFCGGVFEPDAAQRQQLAARGVCIEETAVQAIVDKATVQLADGRHAAMDGLFTLSRTQMASPLAAQLGCSFDDGPLGEFIRTDALKATTVAGVFACGDAARAMGSVGFAVADGAMAGVAAHQSLFTPS
ncbi:thioredoxin reductase [Tahibacter aquaticus]|uniref:Thioredoxin reductase n=1 Tax=Tahibacter aquaticus TaxID=520092 RepID=A0A4R6YWR1_9GAMM|nr:thioredoxin reductase [Tahibacter aquaticus]